MLNSASNNFFPLANDLCTRVPFYNMFIYSAVFIFHSDYRVGAVGSVEYFVHIEMNAVAFSFMYIFSLLIFFNIGFS